MENNTNNTLDQNKIIKIFERILTQANNFHNTSGIDRLPQIKRLAKQGIELLDPENKNLDGE